MVLEISVKSGIGAALQISTNPVKHSQWLRVFELDPEEVKPHTRVCSCYFMNGDPKNGQQANIGRQFASPVKKGVTKLQGLLKGNNKEKSGSTINFEWQ